MLSPSGRELKKKITNKTAKVSVIGLATLVYKNPLP